MKEMTDAEKIKELKWIVGRYLTNKAQCPCCLSRNGEHLIDCRITLAMKFKAGDNNG